MSDMADGFRFFQYEVAQCLIQKSDVHFLDIQD